MTSSLPETDQITAAVITGDHAFDVPGFHAVFREMSEVDSYVQHQDNFAADVGRVRDRYDVLVFYNMPRETPADGSRAKAVLEALGETGQGIFLLHHAILAYREWPFWNELVGIQDRSFGYDHSQEIRVEVQVPDHPITQGLEAWDMVDETYSMDGPDADSDELLVVDHPKSMKTIGWARRFRESRVYCFQSGHDNLTYVDPNFRAVILRGIQWCAGRI